MSDNLSTGTIPAFNPPGFPYQDDKLNPEQRAAWSDTISEWMTNEINGQFTDKNGMLKPLPGPCDTDRTKLPQFFRGTVTPFDVSQKPTPITRSTNTDIQRWRVADAHRDQQDEYLEWTVKRDSKNRITSVTFTCEGPEYWAFLSQNDPDKMLALYKQNNPAYANKIKVQDMFNRDGSYNPYNQWNGVVTTNPPDDSELTTVNPGCIMHLAQSNNTLSAEIDIAAQGTVIRKTLNGAIIKDKTKLCNCSKYGVATRNSDPQIGSAMNGLALAHHSVSIADPVAIYMTQFDSESFMLDPDGSGENLIPIPNGTFTWVRGNISKHMGMRLHVEVPQGVIGTGDNEGKQLTVSDIIDTTNSQNIMFGSQFADYIHMVVNAVVISDVPVADAQFCPCDRRNGHPTALMAKSSATEGKEKRIAFKTRRGF
ncbi:uncharacterized protein DNG_03136 [Cephalotrichum gorgonifer]|uniref:Uncharacterized protein n=1 Tax=Cephalotrichum gorgonifer TaxID=2041049 RepID=A0AAE8STC8_9PEZI|nr:uncharacterized protein DNG_03136 [Cephalotrichum gorgonifer]